MSWQVGTSRTVFADIGATLVGCLHDERGNPRFVFVLTHSNLIGDHFLVMTHDGRCAYHRVRPWGEKSYAVDSTQYASMYSKLHAMRQED